MKKLAVFLLAVLVIGTVAQAGTFNYYQTINVTDTGNTALYVMNLTQATQSNTGWKSGNYSASYALPWSCWIGLYLYDQSYGGWDEVIYIWDQNL